jgi:hypothetical protein
MEWTRLRALAFLRELEWFTLQRCRNTAKSSAHGPPLQAATARYRHPGLDVFLPRGQGRLPLCRNAPQKEADLSLYARL